MRDPGVCGVTSMLGIGGAAAGSARGGAWSQVLASGAAALRASGTNVPQDECAGPDQPTGLAWLLAAGMLGDTFTTDKILPPITPMYVRGSV